MDDELLKLFFAEMREWRATLATKDDLAAMREAISLRLDALGNDVGNLAALISEHRALDGD